MRAEALADRQQAERAWQAELADRLAAAREEGQVLGRREAGEAGKEQLQVALERRAAIEEAYQKGYADGVARLEQDLKASYDEGFRDGQGQAAVPASPSEGSGASQVMLDEAKRQGYQSGYEDGRGVGLAKGRREAETGFTKKLQEAARQAYREGFLDGKRTGGDGDRAWAHGILHLSTGASTTEIKQRYKKLSMVLHPDQNPGLSDDFIKNLNRARELLEG